MDEQSGGRERRNRRTAGQGVLAVGCTLLFLALFWGAAWKLGWWNPGFGMLSAKLAVAVSVGIVALVAWIVKRR